MFPASSSGAGGTAEPACAGRFQRHGPSTTHCWGQSIPADGNSLKINPSQCSPPTLNLSVNTYNQITNSGFSYDNSGNMTADGVTSYVWNGAGFLKSTGSTT